MIIIKSAMYIDFDNFATPLKLNGRLSDVMLNFDRVLSYLAEAGITEEVYGNTNCRRIFQKKVVYFNPSAYNRFRQNFLESGFRIVECPILTGYGKTSADMVMGTEMVKDIYTQNFEDFVILSADVDFTPAIIQINECGRRTVQLGLGSQNKISAGAPIISLTHNDFMREVLFEKEKPKFTKTPNPNPVIKVIDLGETKVAIQNLPMEENDTAKDKEVGKTETVPLPKPKNERITPHLDNLPPEPKPEPVVEVEPIPEPEPKLILGVNMAAVPLDHAPGTSVEHEPVVLPPCILGVETSPKAKVIKPPKAPVPQAIIQECLAELGIPHLTPRIRSVVLDNFVGSIKRGIKKRYVKSSVLLKVTRELELEKNSELYTKTLDFISFLCNNSTCTYDENYTVETAVEQVQKSLFNSEGWKNRNTLINRPHIQCLFKEVIEICNKM
jgi:uncharacterized LabA/DUF88 family protein